MRQLVLTFSLLGYFFTAFAQTDTAALIKQLKPQGTILMTKAATLVEEKKYFEAGRLLRDMDINDSLYVDRMAYAAQLLSDTTAGEADILTILGRVKKYYPSEINIIRMITASRFLAANKVDSLMAVTNLILTDIPNHTSLTNLRSAGLLREKMHGQLYADAKVLLPFQPLNQRFIKRLALAAYAERKYSQFYAWCLYGLANMQDAGDANSYLNLIESTMSEDTKPVEGKPSLPSISALDDIDDILQSGAAGKSSYKYNGPYSQYKVMKQIHLLFNTLKTAPSGGNTALDLYVLPYLFEIQKQGRWPEIVGGAAWAVTDGKFGKMAEFKSWVSARFGILQSVPGLDKLTFRGKAYTVDGRYMAEAGEVRTMVEGDFDAKNWQQIKVTKLWQRGQIEAQYTLNKPDIVEGVYTLYTSSETLESVRTFKGGKLNGLYTNYYSNGKAQYTANYQDGEEMGIVKLYHPSGTLAKKLTRKMGVTDGYIVEYYEHGQMKDSIQVTEGKANGSEYTFYNSGAKSTYYTYKNGDAEGPYISYYETGNKREEGTKKAGKFEGKRTAYHENGRVSFVGTYRNDLQIDTSYNYDIFGSLTQKTANTSVDGTYTLLYYTKGTLRRLVEYAKKNLKTIIYYDATGKEFSKQEKLNKGKAVVKLFSLSGTPTGEFPTNNGLVSGLRIDRYTEGGKLYETNYANDKREGIETSYHENGAIYAIRNYANNEEEGLQQTFYANGTLNTAYFAVNGNIEGYQNTYNSKGQLEKRDYYFEGSRKGWMQTFDAHQKVSDEVFFADGEEVRLHNYFSPTQYQAATFAELNGLLTYKDSLGRKIADFNYVNGVRSGSQKNYHSANGKLKDEYTVKSGEYVGSSKSYTEREQLEYEGTYNSQGYRIGEGKWYNPDGQLDYTLEYFPAKDSVMTRNYGPYGKPSNSYAESDGDIYGWRTYYDPQTGAVAGYLMYDKDLITGYANATATGPGPLVPAVGEVFKINTTYASGKKGLELEIKNGKRNGTLMHYYESGKLFVEMTYVSGSLNGSLKSYYADGAPAIIENYVMSDLYGEATYHYPNGKPRVIANYYNGNKEGTTRYYSATGALEGEFLLKNNRCIK